MSETIALEIEQDTDIDVVSRIETNNDILELINTQTVLVWLYCGLIYMIAGFGIANTLFTLVMDKKGK